MSDILFVLLDEGCYDECERDRHRDRESVIEIDIEIEILTYDIFLSP